MGERAESGRDARIISFGKPMGRLRPTDLSFRARSMKRARNDKSIGGRELQAYTVMNLWASETLSLLLIFQLQEWRQFLKPAVAIHAGQGGSPFRQQRALPKKLVAMIDAHG